MSFFSKLFKKQQPPPQPDIADLISKQTKNINAQFDELFARLDEALEEKPTEPPKDKSFISALVSICDTIEAFHNYAEGQPDEELKAQAELMWKQAGKNLALVGISRIGDEGALFNPLCDTAYQATCDTDKPEMAVLRVLQSGYIYEGEVLRKAVVIVNKLS